jgi:hypothetical protein
VQHDGTVVAGQVAALRQPLISHGERCWR